MTVSKIKEIEGVNKFEGKYGVTYYFNLVMENGDKGQIGKKKEDALKLGDELNYEVEKTEKGVKFKEIREEFKKKTGGYTRNYEADFISFGMSYAKDLYCAGKIEDGKQMLATADIIYNWMREKYLDLNK